MPPITDLLAHLDKLLAVDEFRDYGPNGLQVPGRAEIRRLKPDPVDDALVLRLIELALKAPTGSNQQNWEWIVVRDRAVKEKLGRYNRSAFNLYGALGRLWLERTGLPRCRICLWTTTISSC